MSTLQRPQFAVAAVTSELPAGSPVRALKKLENIAQWCSQGLPGTLQRAGNTQLKTSSF